MKYKVILIIGASGMLGQCFYKILKEEYKLAQVIGISRHGPDFNFDIYSESSDLFNKIKFINPDLIINCAAIVSIDECEKNFPHALYINSEFVKKLSIFCSSTNCRLLQISTDHYYSNQGNVLHDENHPVTLLNNYSKSKHQGEINALKNKNSIVIRTNITGYRNKQNKPTFFEWLLAGLRNNSELLMFDDFYTSTIDSLSLARISLKIAITEHSGIFNIASSECISKYEFALRLAKELSIIPNNIKIGSIHAIKPLRANSLGLDCSKACKIFKFTLPDSTQVIKNLLSQEKI